MCHNFIMLTHHYFCNWLYRMNIGIDHNKQKALLIRLYHVVMEKIVGTVQIFRAWCKCQELFCLA